MTSDDNRLIDMILAGDMDAFGELVDRYSDRASWVAYNMVGNYEDARQIAQEGFLRVFRSIKRFKRGMKFYTWLYQIIVNLSIDHLRKHRKVRKVSIENIMEPDAEGGQPDDFVERDEVRRNVRLVLEELPEKYKTVMVLRDIEGLSCKEIAKIIKCTHATVRWRLHRARNIFREIWEKKFEFTKGERYGL